MRGETNAMGGVLVALLVSIPLLGILAWGGSALWALR
jgi:hypothetical protein